MKNDATVIGLIGLGHALSHFLQLVLPPLFPFMREEMGVSYVQLGFVLTVFYAVSAFLQPLAGFLVDRRGGRVVLACGIALMALGTFITAFAHGLPMLLLGALVSGVGNSVFHPADFAILNARVSQPRLGHAFSTHSISGSLGFAAAPVFSAAASSAYGWRTALMAAAAFAIAVLVLQGLNFSRFAVEQPARKEKRAMAAEASVLLSGPVLACFLFFALHAAALTGLISFGVAAMSEQFSISAAFASSAITAYMVGAGVGALTGGFLINVFKKPNFIAGGALSISACVVLLIASGLMPAVVLPAALALSGFSVGITYPSRDLIVRQSTPAGATGRVFGFVYAGLDLGSLATPVLYGYLMDRGAPQAVFYVIAAFSAAAIFTIVQLVFVANPAAVQKT